MFKRSLLSLVLIAGFACPAVAATADNLLQEGISLTTEAVNEVDSEALSAAAKVFQLIKDNKVALGAALVATAGAVAVAAWYYGYFQTAENNQAENNQVA